MMASDRSHMIHCEEYLKHVAKYVQAGRGAFMASQMCQDAVLWNLQMACLCAERISHEERQRHPTVDWHELRSLAKGLVNEEMRPELEGAWQLAEAEVPRLQRQIRLVLSAKM